MVHVDKKDIAKYGIGPVQIQAIENNVRIYWYYQIIILKYIKP